MARRGKTRIDDRAWRKMTARVGELSAAVKVGVLASTGGDARHPDSDITMVELAAIHEFGSPAAKIPERSFIRSTFRDKATLLGAVMGKLARGVVAGTMQPERALAILGEVGAAEVKKTITEGAGVPPPLKPETVARKGSDRPLVDTGRLLDSITYEVGRPRTSAGRFAKWR